ncbi:hypothetical protein ACGFS9_30700 [Streptomyces sp. NPDC048566]|uniref:hypothetical protein n=1 Tax=Streptomyces sp. NPDC048566 TaxID=3365569 RepID=UPI00371DDD49
MAEGEQSVRLVALLRRIRRDNGERSYRDIAKRMNLAHTRVGALLRGEGLPVDRKQLGALVEALGGGDDEIAEAQKLYAEAQKEHTTRTAVRRRLKRWRQRSGWLEQVRAIAPAEGLGDREAELAELAAFCAGDELYSWWRGEPWAGKSALLSTFALNPPERVEVVGFFLASFASDANAFTDALLEQLAALLEEPVPASLGLAARDASRRRMLRAAAERCRAMGHRLVLIVDGLDQDQGAQPSSGLPSIASLLPSTPADGVQVIVTSRPDPNVAIELPPGHPLHRCRARPLAVSRHGERREHLARRELNALLAGDPLHREVLGLITASGGGLSAAELEELSGLATFEIDQLLDGAFGRTVARRVDLTALEQHHILTFAHESLREEAHGRFGGHIRGNYRERLHAWADIYRREGWPDRTPGYLARGYPQLLAATSDTARLLALALDRARHDRLSVATGSAAASFTEIEAALRLVHGDGSRDLVALVRLAVCRHELEHRAPDVPAGLPAAWAALGRVAKAQSLARSVTDPAERARALEEVAAVAPGTADRDGPGEEPGCGAAATPGRWDPPRYVEPVEAVVAETSQGGGLVLGLFVLCDVLRHAPTEDLRKRLVDEALRIQSSQETLSRLLQLTARAADSAGAGTADVVSVLLDEAEAEAAAITTPDELVHALSVLLDTCARAYDLDRAERIAGRLRTAAEALRPCGGYAEEVQSLARHHLPGREKALRAARAADKAAELSRAATHNAQALALAALTLALADGGRFETAHTWAAVAQTATELVTPATRRAAAFTTLAWAFSVLGDHQRGVRAAESAETTPRSVTTPDQLAYAVVALAQALADAGDEERADRAAGAAARLATAVIPPSTVPETRIRPLVELARFLYDARRPKQARLIIGDAEAAAERLTDPLEQAMVFIALVGVLTSAGLHRDAARLADRCVDQAAVLARGAQRVYFAQAQMLDILARGMAIAGHPTRGATIAGMISHFPSRRNSLARLAAGRAATAVPGPGPSGLARPGFAGVTEQARRQAEEALRLATNGEHEQAADLVADLLVDGSWTAALPALAIVDREALAAAADDLLDGLA